MIQVAAVVPAAGVGRRFGSRTPKLFVRLHDRPLLAHALCALQQCPAIRWIILVVERRQYRRAQTLLKRYRITKALALCIGGSSRAESVAHGVKMLPPEARWVLVHDGARPCASLAVIDRAIREAKRYGAVACGLPATLTVKAANRQGLVQETLKRDPLWFVQTPQVFRRDWFTQALARVDLRRGSFPDDAAILEASGFPVRLIAGDPLNIKVTTREDLYLAEAILTKRVAK